MQIVINGWHGHDKILAIRTLRMACMDEDEKTQSIGLIRAKRIVEGEYPAILIVDPRREGRINQLLEELEQHGFDVHLMASVENVVQSHRSALSALKNLQEAMRSLGNTEAADVVGLQMVILADLVSEIEFAGKSQ